MLGIDTRRDPLTTTIGLSLTDKINIQKVSINTTEYNKHT